MRGMRAQNKKNINKINKQRHCKLPNINTGNMRDMRAQESGNADIYIEYIYIYQYIYIERERERER